MKEAERALIEELRRTHEVMKEHRRGTADQMKIHSKQEFEAMREWFDKREPEYIGSIDTSLYSIPIYTDADVPPGILRIMRDGEVIKDVMIR